MDGDALADDLLDRFRFGDLGGELMEQNGVCGSEQKDVFTFGLEAFGGPMEEPQNDDRNLMESLILNGDAFEDGNTDLRLLTSQMAEFSDSTPKFPDTPWQASAMEAAPLDEKSSGHSSIMLPKVQMPRRTTHHHHHNHPFDPTAHPFTWLRVGDPVRRRKIERWKKKRDRIRSGQTTKHVYDVRVQHAIKRPRTGGRFVSAASVDAIASGTTA
uniref:Uncharacterized protein n=1 Tax=Spongospora subterranea TaxID=70186 RepID=A0A0H5QII9_9EUKA|eukprot:CRZ01798.1 hypothetical protein [Spongospora subterranea]